MPSYVERVPKYRLHKASGQAIVTIAGRDTYLGPWKSKASRIEYDRLIGEWLAAGRPSSAASAANDLTIVELCRDYSRHAETYYVKDGKATGHIFHVRRALKALRLRYGATLAVEFGPLALRAFQNQLIANGNSRGYINNLVAVVKRCFKWAAANEKLPASAYQSLAVAPGLRRGRSGAREPAPIGPVADTVVDATLPHLPPVIADMVRLQRLTGMRPGEVCSMRPCDVDTSSTPWAYVPQSHKTEHHDRQRRVFIGPRGQDVLRAYLLRDKAAYCFVPGESEAKRSTKRRENRRSKLTPSQTARQPKPNRRRPAGPKYTKDAYNRAVCRALVVMARRDRKDKRQKGEPLVKWLADRGITHWHPNQLRHSAATEVRSRFGLEAAQVALGHSEANVTQIYAQRDFALAARVMQEVG
jgi:integrase